jgi:hypothetical protein
MNYFKEYERRCHHCGRLNDDWQFIRKMNALRERVGEPLYISSWYRCEEHDSNIGGKGNHTTGLAVDIVCCSSHLRWKLLRALLNNETWKRIGIHPTFLHVDTVGNKPQEVIWVY